MEPSGVVRRSDGATMKNPSSEQRQPKLLIAAGAVLAIAVVAIVFFAGRAILSGGPRDAGGAIETGLAPDSRIAILDSARSYLREDEPGKAEAILREGIEKAPRDQDLRTLYAEALLQSGKHSEAIEQYEHAIFIGPDSAELRFAAGTVASVAGEPERAIEHYWQARNLAPDNPKHPYYLAQVQRKVGRVEEAKASLLHAGKLDPSLGGVWATLAAISLDENKLSLAETYIERAREVQPDNTGWRIIEAKILRRRNRPQDALRLLGAIPRQQRLGDTAIVEEIGLCYGLLQRPEDAATLYADAAEIHPEDAEILYGAAQWYERIEERDVALIYARRAAALGHEGADALANRLSG